MSCTALKCVPAHQVPNRRSLLVLEHETLHLVGCSKLVPQISCWLLNILKLLNFKAVNSTSSALLLHCGADGQKRTILAQRLLYIRGSLFGQVCT